MVKKITCILLSLALALHSLAQDSTHSSAVIRPGDSATNRTHAAISKSLLLPSLALPAGLIGYGIVSIHNHSLLKLDANVKEELYTEHPHKKIKEDTYLQFAPAALVYGLDAFGIQGKHNLRDRSMIFLMSNVMLNAIVYPVKKYSHVLRPDGSSYTSFPSGHTAEAFASAEFLRQEYKDVSCWYGIAGYTMAAVTGYLRMYNNKHWLGDVVAGAGVGIASTKIAYWLYPHLQQWLFRNKAAGTMILPTWQSGSAGIALVRQFR